MAKLKDGNTQKVTKFNSKEMFKIFNENNFDDLQGFINKYSINSADRDGRNLLINCIIENKRDWAIYIIRNYEELDVNSKDRRGWSALHFAVQCNFLDMVKELLKNKNIDINIADNNGNTALMQAVHNNLRCYEDIIIILLEAGMDINQENIHGIRPNEFLMTRVNDYIRKNNIKLIFKDEK